VDDLDNKYVNTHSKRYEITLNLLNRYIGENDRIISLGSDGQFENLVSLANPGVEVLLSDWDLRFPFKQVIHPYDVAICLEVIEHLKDRNDETEDPASYTHSGIFNLLIETNKILKDNGLFILTTPNLSSWKSILKLIRGMDPYLYWPHVHEFAPFELSFFVAQSGFEIVEYSSFDHYASDLFLGKIQSYLFHIISKFLKSDASIFHLRRSTLFLVARKVSHPQEILASTDWWSLKASELSKGQSKSI
jgi:hypothetical protein